MFFKGFLFRVVESRDCVVKSYPLPKQALFLGVCCTILLKTLWENEKLLVMSNFSFSHSVLYLLVELSFIFIKLEIVVRKLFQFDFLNLVVWKRVMENAFWKGENSGD